MSHEQSVASDHVSQVPDFELAVEADDNHVELNVTEDNEDEPENEGTSDITSYKSVNLSSLLAVFPDEPVVHVRRDSAIDLEDQIQPAAGLPGPRFTIASDLIVTDHQTRIANPEVRVVADDSVDINAEIREYKLLGSCVFHRSDK